MPLHEADLELDRKAMASERTAMAWGRTALAMAALAALTIRTALQLDAEAAGYAIAVPLGLAALASGAYGAVRYRRIKRDELDSWQPDPRALRLTSLATFALAIAAAGLAFLG